MKNIFVLLCLTTFIFSSCSSDDDIDFDTIGSTFEIENVNFIAPEFTVNIPIPQNIDIRDSDVVLVYRLEEIVNGRDVWESLPTASFFFFNDVTGAVEGFLNYRYNFTVDDVDVVLDFDLPDASLLETTFTDNQIFRIVVVPAAFAQNTKVDLSDINAVTSALNLQF